MVASVIRDIRRELRRQRGLGPSEPDDFSLQSESAVIGTIQSTTDLITAGLIALLSIGVLVAAIGVLNAS